MRRRNTGRYTLAAGALVGLACWTSQATALEQPQQPAALAEEVAAEHAEAPAAEPMEATDAETPRAPAEGNEPATNHPATGAQPAPTGTQDVTANRPVSGAADPALDAAQFEIQLRGPVHAAFASGWTADPVEPQLVTQAPPRALHESAAAMAPQGENVHWIPGHWHWDAGRGDYLWISGAYRNVPPGQRWVPGSWFQTANGYRYIPGFYISADTAELTYLPTPPPSQEAGPAGNPPGNDAFWIPGHWSFQNGDYEWSPGFWSSLQQGFVYQPGQYYWTPQGFVFAQGYWDYPLTERGLLFSPVSLRSDIAGRAELATELALTPRNVVPIGPLLTHLFVQPMTGAYYFGNFYGGSAGDLGLTPWVGAAALAQESGALYYDPLLTYYDVYGGDLMNRLRGWNDYFMANPELQPATTWSELQARLQSVQDAGPANADARRQALLTMTTDEIAVDDQLNRFARLNPVTDEARRAIGETTEQLRELSELRGHGEANAEIDAEANGAARSLRLPEAAAFAQAEGAPRFGAEGNVSERFTGGATAAQRAERAASGGLPEAPQPYTPRFDDPDNPAARFGDQPRQPGAAVTPRTRDPQGPRPDAALPPGQNGQNIDGANVPPQGGRFGAERQQPAGSTERFPPGTATDRFPQRPIRDDSGQPGPGFVPQTPQTPQGQPRTPGAQTDRFPPGAAPSRVSPSPRVLFPNQGAPGAGVNPNLPQGNVPGAGRQSGPGAVPGPSQPPGVSPGAVPSPTQPPAVTPNVTPSPTQPPAVNPGGATPPTAPGGTAPGAAAPGGGASGGGTTSP